MKYKVMVVDDDEFICLAVSELLESEGIKTITADGAVSCLEEINKGFKGVILMDIMMPEHDGWDAIRMIVDSGKYENIIIAMLTAKEEPDKKMEGLQTYVAEYITKPFDSQVLLQIVKDNLAYLEDNE